MGSLQCGTYIKVRRPTNAFGRWAFCISNFTGLIKSIATLLEARNVFKLSVGVRFPTLIAKDMACNISSWQSTSTRSRVPFFFASTGGGLCFDYRCAEECMNYCSLNIAKLSILNGCGHRVEVIVHVNYWNALIFLYESDMQAGEIKRSLKQSMLIFELYLRNR